MKKIFATLLLAIMAIAVAQAYNQAPANMKSYRGKNGSSFTFQVTGNNSGRIWGGESNVYTDDSDIATAAVHAGLVRKGEIAVIKITILAGRSSYPAITRNGVTSIKYGSYDGSYKLEKVASAAATITAPQNATTMRGNNGKTYTFQVTGKTSGRIWGGESNVYTDDSDIATAAVHAGLVRSGQTATITLKILAGRSSYPSINRNGVTSIKYGSYSGSYQLMGNGNSTSSTSSRSSGSSTSSMPSGLTAQEYFNIGFNYQKNKDYTNAFQYYLKAAQMGDTQCQQVVGEFYIWNNNITGIPYNPTEGFRWLNITMNNGRDLAIFKIGVCYEQGLGVKKNIAKAREYYMKAIRINSDAENARKRLKNLK